MYVYVYKHTWKLAMWTGCTGHYGIIYYTYYISRVDISQNDGIPQKLSPGKFFVGTILVEQVAIGCPLQPVHPPITHTKHLNPLRSPTASFKTNNYVKPVSKQATTWKTWTQTQGVFSTWIGRNGDNNKYEQLMIIIIMIILFIILLLTIMWILLLLLIIISFYYYLFYLLFISLLFSFYYY